MAIDPLDPALEELHDNCQALQGLTHLIGIANDNETIQPQGLYFLIKLVTDKQETIVNQLYTST